MTRYTRKDAEKAFERLCKALGKRVATSYNDVGAWDLDYNSAYGGFQVNEIVSETGGVTCPLGDKRYPAREFFEICGIAVRAIEAGKS